MLTRASLPEKVGTELGVSDWVEIAQSTINAFAEITEDWQPIHLDPEAGQEAGFGGTVAHGFLTLSMLSKLLYEVVPIIDGEKASLNYGFNKVRFVSPVPGGARVRARFVLEAFQLREDGNAMLTFDTTVEIEGQTRPAITASWLALHVF